MSWKPCDWKCKYDSDPLGWAGLQPIHDKESRSSLCYQIHGRQIPPCSLLRCWAYSDSWAAGQKMFWKQFNDSWSWRIDQLLLFPINWRENVWKTSYTISQPSMFTGQDSAPNDNHYLPLWQCALSSSQAFIVHLMLDLGQAFHQLLQIFTLLLKLEWLVLSE